MWFYVLALIVMSFNAQVCGQLAVKTSGCYTPAICDGQLQWTKLATSTATQIANSSSTDQCGAELRRISESIKNLTQKLERLQKSLRTTTTTRPSTTIPASRAAIATTDAATTQSTITAGDECKGSTAGGCFWTYVKPWVTYNAAKSICAANGSVVAVPRNENSYSAIVRDVWKKITKGRVVGIWVGMTRITNTQQFKPTDAFYKWMGAEPKSGNLNSGVYIHVTGGNYGGSGLAAWNPTAGQIGVACWKPRKAK